MNYSFFNLNKEDGTLVLKINRPKALNALNSSVLTELNEIINVIHNDKDVKVLIITGEGKAFVAGADIAEMKDFSPEEARKFSHLGMEVFRKIELLEVPVIAAINGYALGGGCELAMCCDIRIASEKAKFGQPEVGLGITPGFAGTQRLPRIVGVPKAKELIFTGDIINAVEAEKIGLVNKVVECDKLMEEAILMAKKISSKGPLAVKYSKAAINNGIQTDIDSAMTIEKNLFSLCFASKEQKEGMSAFIDKRNPNF